MTWDDEQVQQRPLLDGDEQLLLVVTQFHTFGVELKRKFSVGAATTKLAVGVLVAHVGTPEVLIVKSRALHAELVARAAPPRLTASLPAPRAPPPECEEEQSRSAARVAAAVS